MIRLAITMGAVLGSNGAKAATDIDLSSSYTAS